MSNLTDQRDALVAHLETVADVGNVHSHPRLGSANDHWVATIDGVKTVRAWEVGLADPGVETARLQQSWLHRYTHWLIRGYVNIEPEVDGLYVTGLDIAHQIADSIDPDHFLTGPANQFPAGTVLEKEPVQIDSPEPLTLGGGVLCWVVNLRLRTLIIVQSP